MQREGTARPSEGSDGESCSELMAQAIRRGTSAGAGRSAEQQHQQFRQLGVCVGG